MSNVLFSIVVTTFNRKDYLKRCLESLKAQSYKNFEVFVYDDGSVDGTREWINSCRATYDDSFIRFHYEWKENWGGPARGRNVGLNWAQGEWCSFLDCDDWYVSNRLEKVLEKTEDNDVIFHELQYANSKGPYNRTTNGRHLKRDVYKDLLMYGNCLSNSAVCFKTKLAREVGGLSENQAFKAVEDYDFWLKLAAETNKFKYIPEVLGYYWQGEDNISSPSLNYIKKLRNLVSQHISNIPESDRKEAWTRLEYIEARNLMVLESQDSRKKAKDLFWEITFKTKSNFLKIKSIYCWLRL